MLVTDGLIDVERLLETNDEVLTEVEGDGDGVRLQDNECEALLEIEDDGDTVGDVEPLEDRLDDKECDWDRELLLEAEGEML